MTAAVLYVTTTDGRSGHADIDGQDGVDVASAAIEAFNAGHGGVVAFNNRLIDLATVAHIHLEVRS